MILYEKAPNHEYNVVSRYSNLRVLTDTDQGQRYLETYNQKEIPEGSQSYQQDNYHVVKSSEVGRLDIISLVCYGTPTYWWVIALANNFIDPFTVKQGDLLRIPSLLTLTDFNSEIISYQGGPSYNGTTSL